MHRSASHTRPAADAEPALQCTILLPIFLRCPDEHCDDDAGADQSNHGQDNSERNGHDWIVPGPFVL
jgi:hypothetical protein